MQSFKFEIPTNPYNTILKNILNSHTSDQIADMIIIGYYVQQSAKCTNSKQQEVIDQVLTKLNEMKNLPELLMQSKQQIIADTNIDVITKLNTIQQSTENYAKTYQQTLYDFKQQLNTTISSTLESSTLKELQKSIEALNKSMHVTTFKGNVGENQIIQALQNRFLDAEIIDTSGTGHKGDFYITFKDLKKIKFMFEIKNYKNTVPTSQITKFIADVDDNDYSYGIFISIGSGIAHYSEMATLTTPKNKHCIIIPRADITGYSAIFAAESMRLLHTEMYSVEDSKATLADLKTQIKTQYTNLKKYQDNTEEALAALDAHKKSTSAFVNSMKKIVNGNLELVEDVLDNLKSMKKA